MAKKRWSTDILSLWKQVLTVFKSNPAVGLPFLFVALFDAVLLLVLFWAPRPPVDMVLAPIIRTFWGDQYLHYPANFLLLPKIFNYGRNVLSFITGIAFTGLAVSFIAQVYQGAKPEWVFGVSKVVKRFFRLFVVWALTMGSLYFAVYVLSAFGKFIPSRQLFVAAEYVLSVAVQMIFVFALPAIIIENRKTFNSIVRSLALVKNHPVSSFLLVFIPSLLFLPFSYVHFKTPYLMDRVFPEIVLIILFSRIVLVTFVDFAVTSTATILLLKHRELESRKTP